MARQVQVFLVDDLDDSPAVRNVTFSIEGEQFEIDLGQKNIDALYKALEPYTNAARRVKRTRAGRPTNSSSNRRPGPDPADVRAWARDQGHQVSERGRVSKEILEAYVAAH